METTNKSKTYIVIAVILITIAILGISYFFKTPKVSYAKELTVATLQEKINNKDTFFVVVKQDNCKHCQEYMPIYEKVLKDYELEGYYINLSYIDEEQGAIFDSLITNITGTPTTVFFVQGQESIMERVEGVKYEKSLIQKFKNTGYIK